MAMNRINIKKIVIGGIGVVLLLAIGYGIHAFVQHINGTSPAQIEARRRMQEAAEQSEKAMYENSQWYRDQMAQPIYLKNSDGTVDTCGRRPATYIDCTTSYSVSHR